MIYCPTCESSTKVYDVRGIKRRRECTLGHRFTTYETVETETQYRGMVLVNKKEYQAFLAVMNAAKNSIDLTLG
jgi:transcriptional regulator NrdR family protein